MGTKHHNLDVLSEAYLAIKSKLSQFNKFNETFPKNLIRARSYRNRVE